MAYSRLVSPRGIAFPLTLLLLVLAVACGTAATATPASKPNTAPPVSTGTQATPTAMPGSTAMPVAPVISPGKLTWMTAGYGSGRFENVLASGGASKQYFRIMHAYLIASSPEGRMVPGVAKDWKVAPDGKTWTVTVRDGVMFHDGKPLTNKDVAWSWTHEWAPEALAYSKSSTSITQLNNTVSIQAVGTNEVTAVLKNGDAGFASGILSDGVNSIGNLYPAREKPYDEAASAAYDKAPIGAGPMKVVKIVTSELIAMERFDDYYFQPKNGLPEDRRVRFKSLDLRQVPEVATRVAALRAGEADIAPVSLELRKQVEANGGRLIFGAEGIQIQAYFWGCWSTPAPACKDKRVRQAFAYALDKKIISEQLYGGPEVFVPRGWHMVSPGSLGYSPDLDPFPFNPDKARQLMTEAGYPGGKGFPKFIVNTWISANTPLLPEQAQLAADKWRRELGIEVEVKIAEETALSAASLSGELYGQMTYRDNEARYDGGSSARTSYGTPESPRRAHEDKELYAQVQAALAVTDPVARPVELNKLYKRLHDEQWILGVGYLNVPWGVGPKVTTWQPFAFSSFPTGLHTITLK